MLTLNDFGYIRRAIFDKKYKEFTRPNELNIIGIRYNNKTINIFDDQICVFYLDDNLNYNIHLFKATTKPGLYWLRNLLNPKGTAILKEGQYLDAYEIAYHRGKYLALCQRLPVEVYRDKNRDDKIDYDKKTIEKGLFGINIHRANALSVITTIDKYSAGCQVIQDPDDFRVLLVLANRHKNLYGNKLTYTLINSEDISTYKN